MTAAIYCRLSREDEEKQSESESIQNQKSMLIKYALDKGWDIYNIYCDEDYSGIDRERPAFRQLIADAEARRFDIVLVKTQSRFTRDMELVEKYIHGLFAEWGIRFVATVDNVDTDIKGNKKARQINGLVNEWYLEDLSENIRTVFDYKRRAGQYIGGFPLYGYRKDPADKNKLIVEPQAAAVVRRIYALYLAGHGTQSIAAILNRDGVPNPTRHKQAMGYPYRNGAAHNDHGLWNRTTVSRILRDQMYTGDLVQGRTKKISYKSKKMASVPQRDWIIVPDSHEPVISRRTFERVQEMLHARTRSTGLGEVHPLAGKVHCMQCGSAMQRYSNGRAAGKYSYLRCKLYATHKPLCTNHNILLDWLEEEVLRRLQCHINRYFDPQQADVCAMEDLAQSDRKRRTKEQLRLKMELEQRVKALHDLYLDKSRGILEEEQFLELNRVYLADKKELIHRLEALALEEKEEQKAPGGRTKLETYLQEITEASALTRELAALFIQDVQIGERDGKTGAQEIKIDWLI